MATLLPYQDFCKQHIILHYISVLLGARPGGEFQSFPIGAVGNDTVGKKLLQDMKRSGMDINNVTIKEDHSTLFSVCYLYPDHTGGNITTDNSASSSVSTGDMERFFSAFNLPGNNEMVLAAPEVPLSARIKLLEYGKQRGGLNIASVLAAETDAFRQLNGFALVDILSINMEEAKSIAQINAESTSSDKITDACIQQLVAINPEISILITDGENGSYCYTNNHLEHTPALVVPVVSTAGAGDAFLAGTIVGYCCGLPLCKGVNDKYFGESPLASAAELGALLASLSVTSSDTIHSDANADFLYKFAMNNRVRFSNVFFQLFNDQ
jgi:sugar/nucleoside kinase (ribokinase family)